MTRIPHLFDPPPWWSQAPVTTLPLSILSHMRSWLCCFIDCIRHLSPFILTSTHFLQRPRSILQYPSNDYVSVPFMAGFRTPHSLIARRIPFVPSRCYRTSPDQPLCADMFPHSTLYVSPLVGCSLDLCILCSCVTVCTRCDDRIMRILFPINDLVPKPSPSILSKFS